MAKVPQVKLLLDIRIFPGKIRKWPNQLKIRFTQVSVGSSPTFGTLENKGLTAIRRESLSVDAMAYV